MIHYKKHIISILSLIIFPFLCLGQQDALVIDLDQALEIALSESNTIKIADMTIEKSGYAQKGAYASLYPNIGLSGSFQRTLKKQKMVMDMPTLPEPVEIEVGTSNNVSAGLSASMPLVNAQLWESLKLSALDVELAVEQARSSKIALIAQVKKAFYGILLAKESLNVMTQVYDNAQKNYEETEKKYAVGKSSEYERLRAQVTMLNAEPNVSSAENAVTLSIWQLKALLGIDLNMDVDVKGSLNDYIDELLVPYNADNTLDGNSTLVQLGIQNRQLESSLRMTKFQYLPTLAASFGYNYVAMGNTFDMNWNPYSVAAVSLNIPIFNGFSKHNSIKQTKIAQNMMAVQMEDTERNIRIAMKNYNDQISLSIKNYHAASSTIEMAEKSYQISEKMYEVGKATIVDLNDAQLALTQSQLTMFQAIYNYMVAKASLDELIGKE